MLVEMAVGDAYGAGFEYVSSSFLRQHHDLTRYVQHPRHAIGSGRYTDDTQMSIAIAEMLVDGRPWTRPALADAFVRVFKRDPRVANVKVLGDAPAMAMGNLFAATSQALSNAAHNAVDAQQQAYITMQAATTQGVATLYGIDTASTGVATAHIYE